MLIAIAASLVVGVSGCTTAFQNARQCKQQMVATYPQSGPALSFERTAVANRGSRVVVEATYRVPNTGPQKNHRQAEDGPCARRGGMRLRW